MIVQALNATCGDAAIVSAAAGRTHVVGLIDGGPPATFDRSIRDALNRLSIDGKNGLLDFIVISHIDSDHIGGILKLLQRGYSFGAIYFNTPTAFPAIGTRTASTGPRAALEVTVQTVLRRSPPQTHPASVREGNMLVKALAHLRSIDLLNPPQNRRLLTGDTFDFGGALGVTVIGPDVERLNDLFKTWTHVAPASSKALDDSVTNLSSLTLLIEHGTQTALFTGDALEDDVISGISATVRDLDHVGLMKVPHHGSNSATNPTSLAAGNGLIERVTADHYVVSADGRSTNPSLGTLRRIVDVAITRPSARGRRVVWLPGVAQPGLKSTPYYERVVDEFTAYNESKGAPVRIVAGTGEPLTVDLGVPLT